MFARCFNMKIKKRSKSRKAEVDFENLQFGKYFADHMLVADFTNGNWSEPIIQPFGPFEILPSMTALHHAQSIFEGMKAFINTKGEPVLFRPADNFERMNKSASRMCMPPIPENIFLDGIKTLVRLDKDWIPSGNGRSLYIRPVYFSFDTTIGVKPADDYRFIVFTSPSAYYYSDPIKVKIEQHYSRAAQGGVGFAKAAGNYGGAMLPTKMANDQGFKQLLWTDAAEHEYIEESGSMNVMFIIDGVLVTPSLTDSKLAGITRDSILTIARSWGMHVQERPISVHELIAAIENKTLSEAFGTGTAANLAHINGIGYKDTIYNLPVLPSDAFIYRMSAYLNDLKSGNIPDQFGWTVVLN